jgi:hypothetical protein
MIKKLNCASSKKNNKLFVLFIENEELNSFEIFYPSGFITDAIKKKEFYNRSRRK